MERGLFPITVNRHLELRLLEEDHAAEMFALIDTSRESLRQRLPWPDRMLTVDDERAFIRQSMVDYDHDSCISCSIFYKGRIAGSIGASIDLANESCAIGYWLGDTYRGEGIMTTACGVFIDFLFGSMRLNRVEIRCDPDNVKSAAIPLRLGFSKDGVLRQAIRLHDRFIDYTVYSLLADEWRAGKK